MLVSQLERQFHYPFVTLVLWQIVNGSWNSIALVLDGS